MNELSGGTTAGLLTELRRVTRAAGAPEAFEPKLERSTESAHGDVASNAALVLAGRLGRSPRELAEELAGALDQKRAGVRSVEVAGPGFLNFRLSDESLLRALADLLAAPDMHGRSAAAAPQRVNVEFVSANPTGPLHVAHGRGAAVGDAVASLLEWTGHEVMREFYVNDAGHQIDLLGKSVRARLMQARGEEAQVPEGGYHGAYIAELAERIAQSEGTELYALEVPEQERQLAMRAAAMLRREQEEDLSAFGVHMDRFSDESQVFTSGGLQRVLDRLEAAGNSYRGEGALWLRTSRFGDEKDRVLIKGDGSHTYFLSDIAYHLDKLERGFDLAIDVWGADHHGHVPRMEAALRALGVGPDFFEVVLIQLVTVMRGGTEIRMSKRSGEFVTLRELQRQTGVDVARYFFLMRRSGAPLTFDLDLALDTSEANPVYKIQYAHARMCSVFVHGGVEAEKIVASEADLGHLGAESEREVVKQVLRFPDVVRGAAAARAPYQVCGYLEELAGAVNAWYHEGNLDPSRRVLAEGPARAGRLALARAVQVTLRNGLRLLGLSAPQHMTRERSA